MQITVQRSWSNRSGTILQVWQDGRRVRDVSKGVGRTRTIIEKLPYLKKNSSCPFVLGRFTSLLWSSSTKLTHCWVPGNYVILQGKEKLMVRQLWTATNGQPNHWTAIKGTGRRRRRRVLWFDDFSHFPKILSLRVFENKPNLRDNLTECIHFACHIKSCTQGLEFIIARF